MRTKQKLILMLLALFTSIGAWAADVPALVNGKTFTLHCARGYVYYNGSVLAGTSNAENASEFAIVKYGDNTFLYDATQSKFVCHTTAKTAGTSGNAALESNSDFSKAIKDISLGSTEIDAYPYYVQEDEFTNWLNMDGTPLVYFNRWTDYEGGNGGNTYAIAIVNESFDGTAAVAMLDAYFNPSATVKYVISDDSGVILTSDVSSATIGETITTLPSSLQHAYCNYSVTPTEIVSGENTVNVTVTYDMPFEASADYANAKWYFLSLRGKWLTYGDTTPYTGSDSKSVENETQQWAFIGTPYGIKIINKAAGEGKFLSYDTPANNINPSMKDTEKAWVLDKNNSGFVFRMPEDNTIYMHLRTPNLSTCSVAEWAWVHTDAGSTFAIEEVPDVVVNVTYDLYVGGEKVNTVEVTEVAANSAVSVPASLTANYSTLAYDISTSGTIGYTDCTITVTATLKDGIVLPDALSNNKKYTLVCNRGALATYTDSGTAYLASPARSALGIDAAGEFAIINFEGNKYLYSVGDEKFVTYQSAQIAPLAANVTGTSDAISFSQTTNSVYEIRFDNSASKILNSSGSYTYGIVINSWGANAGEWDDGCQYIICEAGDFDPTDAQDALDDFFNGPTAFANAIAALKAIPFGTGLNEYSFTGAYASYTVDNITTLESAGYSPANLATAQGMLANYTINLPATGGFYRIKGNTSGLYLAAGLATNGKFNMTDATDGTTVFYYDADRKLTNLGSGLCNGTTSSSWAWVAGASASTVEFQDGHTNGGYGIQTGDANFYDNGDNSASADRGKGLDLTSGNVRYRSWSLEEVTALPVTINSIGGRGYASFYTPVGISSLPSGVKAYIATLTTDRVQFAEITDIPAETAVVLYMPSCAATTTVNLTIGDATASTTGNVLRGSAVAVALGEQEVMTMQSVNDDLGFYKFNGTNLAGFKAFINISDIPSSIKGFSFDFEDSADGIETIQNAETNAHMNVYDLQGRKVNANGKLPKGIYIENGKKVLK